MAFKKIINMLRPAPYQECSLAPHEIASRYKYWRIRIFYSIYLGYVFFYFTRKSFTFAMPAMIDNLGYSKADIGILGSILYVSYGVSKFLSGILSDRANPRYFMAIGLILTGVCNLCFGFSSSLLLFALFWGLNGFFQGWGWPPCTKQLTYWFSQRERGFWWSLSSTSHNVGGALIPLLVAFLSAYWDWRWALYVPGLLGIVIGVLLMERLRDVPQSLGLPTVEVYKGEAGKEVLVAASSLAEASKDEHNAPTLGVKQILFEQVLNNRAVWTLALAYFFVYVVRTGINDWASLYLHNHKGYSLLEAASSVAWFEVGGFFGCIAAGWGSDRFFQGRRVPFMILCALGLAGAFTLFWGLSAGVLWYENILMAIIGFLIFGPQMLVGLAAAEFVDKKAACTANGFAGCFAYVGAAVTGYPLGKVIDLWDWDGFFVCMLVCSFAIFIVLLPLWRTQSCVANRRELLSQQV